MVSQSLETLMLLVKLENDNRVTKKAVDKDKSPPKDKAVIVLTDVQGSTNLWESNPVAMKKALALHDQIIRASRAKFSGYEIDTEGDAFFLALHNVVDAFGFALDLQKSLREAQWDEDILSFPEACHDPVANLRGLRVRMGIHLGEVTTRRNAVIGRLEYTGETMEVAKQVEGLADGGQIVTTLDTWKAASFEAKTKLGDPTILQSDRTISSQNRTKKVVQVCVPGTSLDSNSCHRKLGSNKKAERRYSAYHARAQCY